MCQPVWPGALKFSKSYKDPIFTPVSNSPLDIDFRLLIHILHFNPTSLPRLIIKNYSNKI